MDGRMHAHTLNKNCNSYVLLVASGLDKNVDGIMVFAFCIMSNHALYCTKLNENIFDNFQVTIEPTPFPY